MRKRFPNLHDSLPQRLKRRRLRSDPDRGTSSSAATETIAFPAPPSVHTEDGRSQTVQPLEPQPQDAESPDVQMQTVPEPAASSIHAEGGPWALAFSMVQKRETKLMLAYEEYLSSLQGGTAADPSLSTPEFIKAIVNRAIKDREDKRWRVSLLGKDIGVRKQAERLAKLLLWSEPIVKSAVSNQPYAALAWSGVSILLPLVTSSITQNESMLAGFNSIGDVQMYWRICEETYLPSLDGPPRQHFIEHLAKLYSYIVEYQARVICHLSRKQLTRAWSDISSPGEWESQIKEIDRLNQDCRNILQLLNTYQIENEWKRQLSEMQESRSFLDKIYNVLLESKWETQKTHRDEKATELLHLLASDYQGHKNFNPQKVKGTCEWFLADERFRDWRDSDDSRLLWVSAGPGCGKSVLSRALIDERRLSTNVTTSTVCYFFFKDGDEGRMYAHNALCAILHQLFTQDITGKLIEQALPSHKDFGGTLTRSFSKLWEIFLKCTCTSDSGEIICLIDALDECHVESRKMLINELKGLHVYQHMSKRGSRLKFLITSRPYDDIELSFRRLSNTATYLRFDGDDKSGEIGDEINLVIDARIDDIAQDFSADDRRLITDKLKSTKSRTYLWLHLTIDIIMRSPSEYGRCVDVVALLSSLPLEISQAYEKILDKSKRRDYTEALLEIILAATRPLTLEEANCALTLATRQQHFGSSKALEDEIWPPHTFRDDVKNLCGLFISVYDGKIFFIHQTAREFLLSSNSGENWKGRFTLPKCHSRLSSACLRYLILPDIPGISTYSSPRDCTSIPDQFLFYAAKNWSLHFNSLEAEDAASCVLDARDLCFEPDAWASHRQTTNGSWEGRSALCLALTIGSQRVVERLLREKAADNYMLSLDEALCLASARGHREIAHMLLGHVDTNTRHGNTALYLATSQGHTGIVRMLLGHGAQVDADHTGRGTALDVASSNGRRALVEKLWNHGADVSFDPNQDEHLSALQLASSRGFADIVQMLLDHGANVDANQDDNYTALQAASRNGRADIVRMLLDYGADVNSTPGTYGSALYAASRHGRVDIVQTLLDSGADVDAPSGHSRPLDIASWHGHRKTVRTLLHHGADVCVGDYEALRSAAGAGHRDVVQVLLRHGDGVREAEALDRAIQRASEYGRAEIVRMLRKERERLSARIDR